MVTIPFSTVPTINPVLVGSQGLTSFALPPAIELNQPISLTSGDARVGKVTFARIL